MNFLQTCDLFILDSGLNLKKIRDKGQERAEQLYSKKLHENSNANLIKAETLTEPNLGQICISERAITDGENVHIVENGTEHFFSMPTPSSTMQHIPFSNMLLQTAFYESKQTIIVDPSQRGLGFVHAQLLRDLYSVHQVSPSLLLMQIRSDSKNSLYWTSMHINGKIQALPQEFVELLGFTQCVSPAQS